MSLSRNTSNRRGARSSRRTSRFAKSAAVVAVLSAVVLNTPTNAGAVTEGTYTVTAEMTVRFNPGGFVIGGLKSGDQIRWISGQSAPSNKTGQPGAHLYVRALGRVQSCGWVINDSTKLSNHTSGVGTCRDGFRPTSATESRRQLVDSGIADMVNDYKRGIAIDAIDRGCPIRLSAPSPLYRNRDTAAGDVKGAVNATKPNSLPLFRWRYRVAGTNTLLGYSESDRAWGFIRIQPGQEAKLGNTTDVPGSGECPHSDSSVDGRVYIA